MWSLSVDFAFLLNDMNERYKLKFPQGIQKIIELKNFMNIFQIASDMNNASIVINNNTDNNKLKNKLSVLQSQTTNTSIQYMLYFNIYIITASVMIM